jgi:L-ascorbate metabolism protein UlaG (beta-lactamase superfamily)
MQTFIFIVLIVGAMAWYYLDRPIFGKLPKGERLTRVQASPNYKGGKFVNIEHTPDFAPGISMIDAARSFINKPSNTEPNASIPSVQTDLKKLDPSKAQVVWFGHASYLLQIDGFRILVDPVFSGNASPVSFFVKSFKGANDYQVADMPEIDLLLLTHDHYDHLDYETILKLKGKFKRVATSLGVGAHLNHWGIPNTQIIELDWQEEVDLLNGFKLMALPARHFSGRLFTRAQSLWSSFKLTTPNHKLYLGGDSGYGSHFKEIGEKHGPFDLAILECGQYNDMWPFLHMMPEQVVTAAKELKAEVFMPIHWAKFALALHAWNEPVQRVMAEAKGQKQGITIPRIGEPVVLNSYYPDSILWDYE